MKQIVLACALAATAVASGAVAQQPSPPPPPRQMSGDANGDHVLTRAEAIAHADAQFARLDADHDGTVTPDERRAGMAAMRGGDRPDASDSPRMGGMRPDGPRPDGMRPGGPDGNRAVTAAEFRDRALRRFDRADANHDGRIDPAERQAERDRMRERRDRMGGDMPPPPPPAAQ